MAIFTPQERKALLALAALLLFGQAVALWNEHRQRTPDRELSQWLERMEAARQDSAARPIPDSQPGHLEDPDPISGGGAGDTAPARFSVSTAPIESLHAAPRGFLETGRLRINEASAADLEMLPGIGPALALRIVEERDRAGPFRHPEDLLRVKGIGPKTLSRLRNRVDCSTEAALP